MEKFNATFVKDGVARDTNFIGRLDDPHPRVFLMVEKATYVFDRIENGRAVYNFERRVAKKDMMDVIMTSFLLGTL